MSHKLLPAPSIDVRLVNMLLQAGYSDVLTSSTIAKDLWLTLHVDQLSMFDSLSTVSSLRAKLMTTPSLEALFQYQDLLH